MPIAVAGSCWPISTKMQPGGAAHLLLISAAGNICFDPISPALAGSYGKTMPSGRNDKARRRVPVEVGAFRALAKQNGLVSINPDNVFRAQN